MIYIHCLGLNQSKKHFLYSNVSPGTTDSAVHYVGSLSLYVNPVNFNVPCHINTPL